MLSGITRMVPSFDFVAKNIITSLYQSLFCFYFAGRSLIAPKKLCTIV
jgi:hypothetical protein